MEEEKEQMSRKGNNNNFAQQWFVVIFMVGGFLILISAIFLYYMHYDKVPFNINNRVESLGQFGDFIGGFLNPIFAFLSFCLLLITIRIQNESLKSSKDELELTREELKETRKATRDSATALKEQSNSIKLQNFENTFFNMLDLHNKIVDSIKIPKNQVINYHFTTINNKRLSRFCTINIREQNQQMDLIYGRDALDIICKNIETFKSNRFISYSGLFSQDFTINTIRPFPIIYDLCHESYKKTIGHYFGNVYQVLKFISESDHKIIFKERYANLFRSQFSSSELKMLFYHCTGSVGSKKFKNLIEKFSFFEHLHIETSNPNFRYILYKSIYEDSAFGINNNDNFVEKDLIINEIDEILEKQKVLGKIKDDYFCYLPTIDMDIYIKEYIEEIDKTKMDTPNINRKVIKIHDYLLNKDKEKAKKYLEMAVIE